MALLTGRTEDGQEVPVQVKPDGRLVAEGLTGPTGAQGPVGPQGPQGVPSFPGVILQVVGATVDVPVINSTAVFMDTGLTATITPRSATSKVLVFVNQTGVYKDQGDARTEYRLVRGQTPLISFEKYAGYNNAITPSATGSCSTCYVDAPATTSPTVYKTQFANIHGVERSHAQVAGSVSSIVLMEVAG